MCGTSGSGKTTLAQGIAAKLGYPHVELDALYHLPDWGEPETHEFKAKVAAATIGERWVVDGNYSKVREQLWARVDTVVWLDYPLPLILWRLTRRTLSRSLRREELWESRNRENLLNHFFVPSRSLYWWVLTTYKRRRREFKEWSTAPEYAHIQWILLSTPGEANEWLHGIDVPSTGYEACRSRGA